MRFDREAEEQFLNKPVILQVAELLTEQARAGYSDRHYASRDFGLRIGWLPTEAFRAEARILQSSDHQILLSYGTAIDIYRDAFVLPETCQRVLVNGAFDRIFDLVSYGNHREDVLPAGLSPMTAKIEIVRLMTTWLYLHEQAHLLQRHGEVAKTEGAAELLSHDEGIVDVVQGSPKLDGSEAALRHSFELAADYEAIANLMMAESVGMSEARLWCLAAGLMCMFHRFYGASSAEIDDAPHGSHPHPAVRMRMAMKKIQWFSDLPELVAAAKWTKGSAHARAVMDHAVYTADIFWHLRYLGMDARSPLLDAIVLSRAVPASYQSAIFDVWKQVRPGIVAGHLGHGEPVVMFLRNAQSVG